MWNLRFIMGGLILIAAIAGLSYVASPIMAWVSGQPREVWRVALTVFGFWAGWHVYRLAVKQ